MAKAKPTSTRDFAQTWAASAAGAAAGKAERHLMQADLKLGRLIARVVASGGRRCYPQSNTVSHFDALARSIIYQQLSKKAAATIYARYLTAAGRSEPRQILAVPDAALRSAGLSRPKIKYLKALAKAVTSCRLDLDRIEQQPDQAIVDQLTTVPGIGVWTAQMFLMFRLRRPDVLATGDLGIRRGVQLAYGLKQLAAPGYIARVGKKWAPYRSLACLYLWAALDLET